MVGKSTVTGETFYDLFTLVMKHLFYKDLLLSVRVDHVKLSKLRKGIIESL